MTCLSIRQHLRRRARLVARGFTLVEMSIAVTIFALCFGMVAGFYANTMGANFVTEQKNLINRDMRNMTLQFSYDACQSSFFVLYSNYTATSRATPSQELLSGDNGDFIVFVTYGAPPSAVKFNIRPISEIIGYYRAPYQANQVSIDPITNEPSTVMPVRKFDISVANGTIPANQYLLATGSTDLPAGGTATTLEALLPNDSQATIDSHQIIIQLAQGLNNGLLFSDLLNHSIMINGAVMHGNNNVSATDTYNFTVSPRG